jgi:protein TonB
MLSHPFAANSRLRAAMASELIDIDLPAPEEEKAPLESAPVTIPLPKTRTRLPRAVKEPPPSSELAQAAAVVTRQEEPHEPIDLTGFVTGTATAYAGGTTASTGKSKSPVYGRANITGTGNGEPMVDRSRPPGVVGDSNWNCPFPLEADVDRISNAIATIRVAVDAADKITRVDVLQDPAHGFGEAARRCAMGKSWRSARNLEGIPVVGSVTVRVHFIR